MSAEGKNVTEIPMQEIDSHKVKSPSYLPMMPPSFFPIIGKVITIWSPIETLFDQFLRALMRFNQTENKPMHASLRKRRSRFRQEARTALAQMPSVAAWWEAILSDSESLYIKRNLIAHGHLRLEIQPIPTAPDAAPRLELRLLALGILRGQPVQDRFTVEQLDDLYYDLAHLLGRIATVSIGRLERGLASSEIEPLRTFLQTNHPTYPNLPISVIPPGSSPG